MDSNSKTRNSAKRQCSSLRFGAFALIIQIGLLLIFGFKVQFSDNISGSKNYIIMSPKTPIENPDVKLYPYLKDIIVMMVVGYGFLMVYLRSYGYSAISYNIFLVSIVVQWSIIINGTTKIENNDTQIFVDISVLIKSFYSVCAVLISFASVIGKTSLFQLLVMALIEIPVLAWTEFLGRSIFYTVDTGNSIFVHGFGAYFGLGVMAFTSPTRNYNFFNKSFNLKSNYSRNLMSMIGTLFLWVYWPSFNSLSVDGHARGRAIVNTVLALTGSTTATAIVSLYMPDTTGKYYLNDEYTQTVIKVGKFNFMLFNSCIIAGGVAIGSCCAMIMNPVFAILIGFMGGLCSVILQRILSIYLADTFMDLGSVQARHGFTALISAVASSIAAVFADYYTYADELYYIFPALASRSGQFFQLIDFSYTTTTNLTRTPSVQAAYQMVGWSTVFLIAVISGIWSGLIMRGLCHFENIDKDHCYEEDDYWYIPNTRPQDTSSSKISVSKSDKYNSATSETYSEISTRHNLPDLKLARVIYPSIDEKEMAKEDYY